MTVDLSGLSYRCDGCERTYRPDELDAASKFLCPRCRRVLVVVTSSESDSLQGRTIGSYLVTGRLGAGAMGVVYRAVHLGMNKPVALKVLHESALTGPTAAARFRREVEVLARLEHPHIVRLLDAGEIRGLPFFTMELVEGLPFQSRPKQEKLRLLVKVARAAHAAHEAGVVHRDLKPANILVGHDGEPRVTDFGVAKMIDAQVHLTLSTAIIGTPSYMAPEQISGKSIDADARTDGYALGVILYEILAGRPPFTGDSAVRIHHQILFEEPARPGGGDLATVCLKAIEKEKARRYATAAEFADDLERAIAGDPIQARPTGALTRAWRRLRPWWIAAALLILLAGVLGVRLIGAISSAREERKRLAEAQRDRDERRRLAMAPFHRGGLLLREVEQMFADLRAKPEAITERAAAARREFEEALRIDESYVEAHLLLAALHELAHEREAAEGHFTRAIELAPDLPMSWFQRGRSRLARYNNLRGSIFGRVGRQGSFVDPPAPETPDQAELRVAARRDFRESGRRGVDPRRLLLADGWNAQTEGRLDDANRRLDGYLAQFPTDADAHFLGATIRLQRRDFAGAEDRYSRTLALRPLHLAARLGRASVRMALLRYAEAEEDAAAYLESAGGQVEGWITRAGIRSMRRDFAGARADIARALALNDGHALSYSALAGVEYAAGDFVAAERAATRAIEIEPLPSYYVLRAQIRDDRGDSKGAEEDYDEAIRLNPADHQAWLNRGILKGRSGRLAEALQDINKALELAPNEPLVYSNRATARLAMGDAPGAEEDLTKLIQLEPTAEAYERRGTLRVTLKDWKGALDDLRKAVETDPSLEPRLRTSIERCEKGE